MKHVIIRASLISITTDQNQVPDYLAMFTRKQTWIRLISSDVWSWLELQEVEVDSLRTGVWK